MKHLIRYGCGDIPFHTIAFLSPDEKSTLNLVADQVVLETEGLEFVALNCREAKPFAHVYSLLQVWAWLRRLPTVAICPQQVNDKLNIVWPAVTKAAMRDTSQFAQVASALFEQVKVLVYEDDNATASLRLVSIHSALNQLFKLTQSYRHPHVPLKANLAQFAKGVDSDMGSYSYLAYQEI